MNELPIEFPENSDGETGSSNMRKAVFALVDIMWKVGDFRFRHHDVTKTNTHRFYCCQDERYNKFQGNDVRDTPQMTRYKCKSSLLIRPCFETRTVELSLKHEYHSPYIDKSLSPEIINFIELRSGESTPGDIFRDAQAAELPGSDILTISQVQYRWVKLRSGL